MENNLCKACKKQPIETSFHCSQCLEKKRIWDRTIGKNRRYERIAKGLCGKCGKLPLKSKTMCSICLKKINTRNPITTKWHAAKRKIMNDKGFCLCGGILSSKTMCQKCLDRGREYINRDRDKVYQAYGGYKCNCCGETEKSFLTIDHVNNDGAEHRRNEKTNYIYRWLINNNFPSGFQILCMNCQWGKLRNEGICPHKFKGTSQKDTEVSVATQ